MGILSGAQDVRAIGREVDRRLHAIDHRVHATRTVGLAADGVDAAIGTAAPRHLLQHLVDVDLLEVDRLGAAALGEREALGDAVDRDHPVGLEHECALDRELRDRTAAPHRHGVAGLDVAVLGRHVAGGEDVGEEEHLLVGEVRLDLDRPHVGVRHAQVRYLMR